MVRAARRTADETLHPLEREVEQRRQARASEQHGTQREPQRHREAISRRDNPQSGLKAGRVADVMSRDVRITSPDATVQQAARLMREEDTGVLPVGEGDRLVGMVTDRDVALRLVAEARDPARTKVREVMTPEVHYVFEDDGLEQAAEAMAEQQVRRLPVLSRGEKRLVGVVSLGDLAAEDQTRWIAGQALSDVTTKGAKHDQSVTAE
jgi:CBS domain-containing protein